MAEMEENSAIRIKVIGVGGAGNNMVDRLMLSNPEGVHLANLNTDQQALNGSPVLDKICIGKKVTHGLGAGGDLEAGREAALADKEKISELVQNTDLVFVTAGLGGGTGTGAAPVVAREAAQVGAIVIAFVALPFTIERAGRSNIANDGLKQLQEYAHAVIPLPNDLLVQEADEGASLLEAFAKADEWIEKAIRSIWSMLHMTGVMNIDFSMLRQIFAQKSEKTLFGIGSGEGPEAIDKALRDLELCPLLHTPEFSKTADTLLVNIIGGPGIGMSDTQRMVASIGKSFGADADVVMGAVVDDSMGDRVEVCVIGTSGAAKTGSKLVKPSARDSIKLDVPSENASSGKGAAKKRKKRSKSPSAEQHEFAFSEGDPKGEFENSSQTIFEGQDLDTPTFMRRGIKIPL